MEHKKVLNFLEESKIYWHARGYGESNPQEYENFGITTVESMAAGCIPIVINLGAQPEIIDHKINGYCWNEPNELIHYTKKMTQNIPKNLLKNIILKSKSFSKKIFRTKINNLIKSL